MRLRIKKGSSKHLFLTLVVASLSLAYIPLELAPGPIGTADVLVAGIVCLGFRYGAFTTKFSVIELTGSALAAWILLRMSLLSILEGESVEFSQIRDALAIITALILFRIAKQPHLRNSILNGVVLGLVIALTLEAYQLIVGHGSLRAAGYAPPEFNYDTAARTYRPFGGFFTPVIFGAYLALAVSYISFATPKHSARYIAAAGVVGIMLTFTRGAWIGLAVAAVVGVLVLSPQARSRLTVWMLPAGILFLTIVLVFPGIFVAPVQRLLTVTDSAYSSNAIRLELWTGTLSKVMESPIIGFGGQSYSVVMAGEIGLLSEFGHPHNTFIMISFRYGIIGLILFMALLLSMITSLLTRRDLFPSDRAAGIAIITAFLVCSMVETTWGSIHLILLLFTGIGLSLAHGRQPTQVSPRSTLVVQPTQN